MVHVLRFVSDEVLINIRVEADTVVVPGHLQLEPRAPLYLLFLDYILRYLTGEILLYFQNVTEIRVYLLELKAHVANERVKDIDVVQNAVLCKLFRRLFQVREYRRNLVLSVLLLQFLHPLRRNYRLQHLDEELEELGALLCVHLHQYYRHLNVQVRVRQHVAALPVRVSLLEVLFYFLQALVLLVQRKVVNFVQDEVNGLRQVVLLVGHKHVQFLAVAGDLPQLFQLLFRLAVCEFYVFYLGNAQVSEDVVVKLEQIICLVVPLLFADDLYLIEHRYPVVVQESQERFVLEDLLRCRVVLGLLPGEGGDERQHRLGQV